MSIRRLLTVAGIMPVVFNLTLTTTNGQDKNDWDRVIAAAKREGKVVVYGVSTFRPMVDKIRPVFEKRYGVTIEYLSGRSREVRERVNTEVRTRRQFADVAQAGATSLPALWQDGGLENWLPPSIESVQPKILKVVNIPSVPLTPTYATLKSFVINTRLAPPGEEPKSWKDLADPKWKGKILMDDPRSAGAGQTAFIATVVHPDLGESFHQQLAMNKPVVSGGGSYQQIAVRVAQGEYAIGFPADADTLDKLEGSPIKWIVPKEGVNFTIMLAGLVKNAPRPNAGKLFINFILSEEFQQVVGKTDSPITKGAKPARPEWSLDHASLLLPRLVAETRKERDKFYRLAESIYGLR